MEYEAQWARAFVLTLAVELPLYAALLRLRGFRITASCAAAFIANAISHPLFWFCFPSFEPYWAFLLGGEGSVIAVETGVLFAIARLTHANSAIIPLLAISGMVNAVSAAVGLAVL